MKEVFRFQPAPGQKNIGHADGGGIFELHPDVIGIILLQKAAVNDAEDVLLVFTPIVRHKLD